MSDSWIIIIVIVVAAGVLYIFPVMTLADRTDDISQIAIQAATTEFAENVANRRLLTLDGLEQYQSTINATGNPCDVEITIQQLDENPGSKTTQEDEQEVGENKYYIMYWSQVQDKLNSTGRIKLKEGDIISVTARNTNVSLSRSLRNLIFMVQGDDQYDMMGQATVLCPGN